jgi:hypothetical protein
MIVIIVGMHCSGTSAVAGLLHRHGVVMVDDDLLVSAPVDGTAPPLFENPRFRILNDRIAERQGYVVESWNPEIPPCRPGAITRLRMRRLIRNYEERHRVWGFEDPRSCLTLDAWLREIERVAALEGTRIVYTVRDPDAVAHSMVTRNRVDIPTALRLWKVYNERAMKTIDAWLVPCHYLLYEDLRDRPERTTAALLRFAGVPDRAGAFGDAKDTASSPASVAPGTDGGGLTLSEAVMEIKSQILRRVRRSQRDTEPDGD